MWEALFGVQLWNYSNLPLQINKYAGLIPAIGYGGGAYLIFRFIYKPLLGLIRSKVNFGVAKVICCTLGVLIVLDTLIMAIQIVAFGQAPMYWQGRINPLHVYPVLTDEGDVAPPEVVFNAHLQFLEDFFKITLKGIAQDAFEELNNLIKLTYESVGITHDTDCTDFKPEQYPTFDTLKDIVEKEMQRTDLTPMRKANLERVNTYVQKFAKGGMYSSLWNGPSTLEVDSRFVVFNFQSLFGAKNQTVANAQILVVMRYLDMQIINIRELNRNGYGDVVHPLIVLDEGYNFIDPDYPVALQFAYLWYKRIRKYEGSIFFLTQNLSDIFGNEKVIQKTSAIVNNSQYSFVFGLAPADLEILTDLYKNVGGLNPTERAFISDAGNGDCFAICSARQRTRFHVEAHDTVRAIFENVGKPWEERE